MIGSLRWNFLVGIFGMFLTTLFSLNHNLFLTSLLRGIYSFIILFVFCFFIRWFLGTILEMNPMDSTTSLGSEEDQHKGSHVDLSTPDGDELISPSLQDESASEEEDFSHLNPPKLASKNKMDPEEMVKAIRKMSED
jgi:hypothetical protein